MSVLLDTHVWLWWLTGQASLPDRERAALDLAPGRQGLCLSAISLWEAQMLYAKRRIDLPLILQLEAAHPRHEDVEHQAARLTPVVLVEKFVCGSEGAAGEADRVDERPQQRAQPFVILDYVNDWLQAAYAASGPTRSIAVLAASSTHDARCKESVSIRFWNYEKG